MKSLLFRILKKIVFIFLEFKNLYVNRFIREYYTSLVYKKAFNIGADVKINGKIKVSNFRGLTIGNNVHIGGTSFINAEGGVIIGDNTHISRNVSIYSSSHNYEGEALPYDQTLKTKPVVIGKNVWIGMNVSIAPGVTIGEGSIIGIGVVLNKSVEPGSIIVQTGFKQVSTRNFEHYDNLNAKKIYGGQSGIKLSEEIVNDFFVPISECQQQVFILSTGRAGSQSIATVLDQHPKIKGQHEPHWELFKLSTEYEYGIISKEELTGYLKEIYSKPGLIPVNHIYAESDQKLSNLVPILNEIFPNSKFIWCIRKPEKFVKSAFTRGWYQEKNKFDNKGRLIMDPLYSSRACRVEGDKVGEFTTTEWNDLDAFAKCCWYWSFWNAKIENLLSKLDKDRWIKIDIDKLSSENERLERFIGISDFHFKTEHKNKAHKRYKKNYTQFEYTDDQLKVLEEMCGPKKVEYFG
ncbi:acyltransferase [Salinimicrobium gaetbulicola]|uniref:Acyltransferase n=1 Tax=Salinimicrobium gaetbulicola TaxID=999702 RepID=A0ABW3IDB2_9FLAO